MTKAILTSTGANRIKTELEHIKSFHVERCARRVEEERKNGSTRSIRDALDEQEFFQRRIVYLENLLSSAKILEGRYE
ncbi:hypothetical protein JCM10914A_56020 [Paenibacillus sp. JCM 10914]|uniref:hypothetical protein n=1 Tax=Paenibacillus sp. JCM 10914 TaxID=1236974 RepID=UPI00056AF1D1|nr:hypothetical protein [Paenibacillus sp. JCM 10914]